jgi:hypothetical protein
VWHIRKIGQAGRSSISTATDIALGMNRARLGLRSDGTAADWGGSEVEMACVEEEEATGEAEDVKITEIATPTGNDTGTETEMEALASNKSSDPWQPP